MKNYLIIILVCIASHKLMAQFADTSLIRTHFVNITKSNNARNYKNLDELNRVGSYIENYFNHYADTCYRQAYEFNTNEYFNVVASFGPLDAPRVIIGAHYDVCGDQEGADDNASGIIGLLELARLLDTVVLDKRIDLVAYTLEEPPFFRTEKMGSFVHASSLKEDSVQVELMICLEMIAYFTDEEKSQDYPVKGLSLTYGNKGDYITLVKKTGAKKVVKKTCKDFKKNAEIKTKIFTGPPNLPGIDFSDHLNYWSFGFPALMITDTAFFRNKNYHKATDTMETLNFLRMSQVIDAIFKIL